MSNKISGYSPTEPVAPVKSANNGGTVAAKPQNGGPATATTSTQGADQLTLTSSARSLQQIEETLANTPVVNTDKVTAVRQQLSAGTYKIDSGRVASKLLQYESALQ